MVKTTLGKATEHSVTLRCKVAVVGRSPGGAGYQRNGDIAECEEAVAKGGSGRRGALALVKPSSAPSVALASGRGEAWHSLRVSGPCAGWVHVKIGKQCGWNSGAQGRHATGRTGPGSGKGSGGGSFW